MPLISCPRRAPSRLEDGLVSLELLMTEDDLSIVIEPRMGLQPSIVTRNSDSNLCLGSSPREEPGKDQGFFEAGCSDGGVSASDLHQPSQAWDRGNQPQSRFAFSLEEHFFREAEETRKGQDPQGEFNKEEEPPGLNKDGSFARRKLKNLMYPPYC
jgi:hypothetical protein